MSFPLYALLMNFLCGTFELCDASTKEFLFHFTLFSNFGSYLSVIVFQI